MMDPGGSHSHSIVAPPPFSFRANMDPLTPEQILAYGPPRGRGDMGQSGPPLQAMSSGNHQFHGAPPPGWLDVQQSRGGGGGGSQGGPGQRSVAVPSMGVAGMPYTGGPPRRSPRAGSVFRFDFPPPHHHMHPPPPPSHGRQHSGGPSVGSPFISVQHRGVPSPRNVGGVGPPTLQQHRPQLVRVGGPGGGLGGPAFGPRRRLERLHFVGPFGEPVSVGSPTAAIGGVGGEGEVNSGPETVSRVLIPNCKIGAVIGKGGAIIKHIREVSGAKVTISDSCTGLHDDADDRMVTAAGTFNSVQLAFTHILSHAGAVGPDADPVMGLAGGDPDCVANAFRLLIPNVKAGGLIGRGGCTIKAIREHSGARIEISSHAFHFHPVHGPLPAPSMSPAAHGGPGSCVSSAHNLNGGGQGGGGARIGISGNNGFGPGMRVGGGPSGSHGGLHATDRDRAFDKSNIILPPPILMDRVMTAMGSFDACLRAHHLVASKLMDVRPSPLPMPGPGPTSVQAAAAAVLANHARGGVGAGPLGYGRGHGPHHGMSHGLPRVFNFEVVRGTGGGGGGGLGENNLRIHSTAAPAAPANTTPTPSTSPASSVSELSSSCHRQPWNFDDRFEDRSWAANPSSPPISELRRGVSGTSGSGCSIERLSMSSSPGLASSSARGSPLGSTVEVADGSTASSTADKPAQVSQLSLATAATSTAGCGSAAPAVLETSTALSSVTNRGSFSAGSSYVDDEKLPACLVDIIDSFFGGSSSGITTPRSPSTITGIDVEVGRAAFALLGVRDLDDIKHLSGAGIIAPESPESYCHLSGEMVAAAAAVLRNGDGNGAAAAAGRAAAHGTAPADGLGLAAAESNMAACAAASSSFFSPPGSSSSTRAFNALGSRIELALAEGFGKEDDGLRAGTYLDVATAYGGDTTHHLFDNGSTTAVTKDKENMGDFSYAAGYTASFGDYPTTTSGGSGGPLPNTPASAPRVSAQRVDGGAIEPNRLKTVRITGTAEEVQLAEYLIRVRTAGRYMVAA